MGLFSSSEEKQRKKGRRIFKDCPNCDSIRIRFRKDEFECTACDLLLVSSGVWTSDWECIEGPDELVGEVKPRNVWAKM